LSDGECLVDGVAIYDEDGASLGVVIVASWCSVFLFGLSVADRLVKLRPWPNPTLVPLVLYSPLAAFSAAAATALTLR